MRVGERFVCFRSCSGSKAVKRNDKSAVDETALRDAERLIEAVVFAWRGAVSEAELRRRLPRDIPLEIVLERLVAFYRDRGVKFTRLGRRKWHFDHLAGLRLLKVTERPVERKMPRAAVEVLAQIAWGQPISLAAIDERRGVRTSPHTLQLLLEGGWIDRGPILQEPGDPVGWVTTRHFLEQCVLESLSDLPDPDELERGLLDDPEPQDD